MQVKIRDIKIGQRLRENDGDMQGLADSIEAYGLLHPIVIDQNNNLVAGCRRLLACERLGWKEIEVKKLENLSEKELREIELEENIKRKDLTPIENSRHLIELAELKEAKIPKDEFRTEAVRKGRPAKPGSIREVAKEIGVSPMTLHDAQKHVEAVKKYPDLEQVPKYKAISEARERDGVISLAKEKVRRAEMENRQLDEDEIVYKRYRKACKGLSDLRFMLESSDDMLALARFSSMYSEDLHDPNDPSDIVGYDAEIEFIDRYIDTLKQIKGHLLSAKAKGVSYGKK